MWKIVYILDKYLGIFFYLYLEIIIVIYISVYDKYWKVRFLFIILKEKIVKYILIVGIVLFLKEYICIL